jgi:hypothetical protein
MAVMMYQSAHDLSVRLVDETLTAELDDYIARRGRNPHSLPPATVTLQGYVRKAGATDGVPDYLARLPPGRHEVRVGNLQPPLPHDRPMWRFAFVTGVGPADAAAILLVHHAVADGFGTVAQGLNFLEPPPEPLRPDDMTARPSRLRTAGAIVGLAQRHRRSAVSPAGHVDAAPLRDIVRGLDARSPPRRTRTMLLGGGRRPAPGAAGGCRALAVLLMAPRRERRGNLGWCDRRAARQMAEPAG